MTLQEIQEMVIRAEGFADGVKYGYQLCAKHFVEKSEEQAKRASESSISSGNTEVIKPESNREGN